MLAVRADYPTDWPHANVYTLADLHIGDAHCDESEVLARVKAVQDDPYGLCVLNGDLMNTALRNSVSDVYGEVLSTRPTAAAADARKGQRQSGWRTWRRSLTRTFTSTATPTCPW